MILASHPGLHSALVFAALDLRHAGSGSSAYFGCFVYFDCFAGFESTAGFGRVACCAFCCNRLRRIGRIRCCLGGYCCERSCCLALEAGHLFFARDF